MFDAAFRARLDAPLARSAERLSAAGVSPNTMTSIGLVVGIACCVAVAAGQWWIGLALWIANRLADGLDGPLARSAGPTDWGGFFDIMADFTVYSGVIVAIGIALPETRVAALAVLMTYYLSGGSFLAFSSLATKRRHEGDGRSLVFPAGVAEGSETIAAMIIILALPGQAEVLLWVWAGIVGFTFLQRLSMIHKLLNE